MNQASKLAERIPENLIATRMQGGTKIRYIEWHTAADLLDERAPGWTSEIKEVGSCSGKIYVRVALTIEGITRENIGYEDEKASGYGDSFSNAFAMAFKRTAALFGLGRHLYDKDDAQNARKETQRHQALPPPAAPFRTPPIKQEPPQDSAEAIDWHKEIVILWKQLKAYGKPEFKDGETMLSLSPISAASIGLTLRHKLLLSWVSNKSSLVRRFQLPVVSHLTDSNGHRVAALYADKLAARENPFVVRAMLLAPFGFHLLLPLLPVGLQSVHARASFSTSTMSVSTPA